VPELRKGAVHNCAGAEANWLAAAGDRLAGLARRVRHAGAWSAEAFDVFAVSRQSTCRVGLLSTSLRGAGVRVVIRRLGVESASLRVLPRSLFLLKAPTTDLPLNALLLQASLLRVSLLVCKLQSKWDFAQVGVEVLRRRGGFFHCKRRAVGDWGLNLEVVSVLVLEVEDGGAGNGTRFQSQAQFLVELLHAAQV